MINMTKSKTLHIRVNENVKANAEETLGLLGISISEAVNMFLCQVNLTGGLPFEVKLPAPERVMVHSQQQLSQKLDEAEKDVDCGKISSAEEIFDRLRGKYDV